MTGRVGESTRESRARTPLSQGNIIVLNGSTSNELRKGAGFAFGPFLLDVSTQTLWRGNERVALGNRSLAILQALIEQPGVLVPKAELFKRAWPDISVDEANLRVQVGALRKVLGEHRSDLVTVAGLGYKFNVVVTKSNELQQSSSATFYTPKVLDKPLGRDEAIPAVTRRLAERRLVTIVGPGGIGKTTLALVAIQEVSLMFRDGVCFVDLGVLNDGRPISETLATALKQPLNTADPLKQVLEFLKSRQLLVVLDCCEHVIEVVALLVEQILEQCPDVRILATSREALRAAGEFVEELGALETPAGDDPLTAKEALCFPAVQLFARSATFRTQRFEINDDNASSVTEICRRLDGIPLAIELAAALTSVSDIAAIRDGLNQRFALLTLGRRTSLPRHRTLAAMMAWSYDLLSDNERAVLRRLSTFAGKFTMSAAVAVSSGDGIDEAAATRDVIALASKSLLAIDRYPLTYRLLETTRVYALARRGPPDERKQAAHRHAMYYANLLEKMDWERYAPGKSRDMIAGHVEEMRVAIEWAYASERPNLGVILTLAAERTWLELTLFAECIQRMRQALVILQCETDHDPRQRMKALVGLSIAQVSSYSPGFDPALLKEALVIADELGDVSHQLRALWQLVLSGLLARRFDEALEYARRFRFCAVEEADIQLSDHLIGCTHLAASDLIPAREHLERFLCNYTSPPRTHAILYGYAKRVSAKGTLAIALWLQGLPERALALTEEALVEANDLKHQHTSFFALGYGTCFVAFFTGDFDAGRRHLQTLKMASRLYKQWENFALAFEGMVARHEGDLSLALRRFEQAMTMYSPASAGIHYAQFLFELAEARRQVGDLDGAEKALGLALGCRSGPEDVAVVCNALRLQAVIIIARAGEAAGPRAEALLLESIRIARTQHALTPELKSATDLARLWNTQGRPADAKALLEAILNQMTEGFQLPLLLNARALVETLQSPAERSLM
jgi:predicted ATPase/DNA-binding winged helix-turn-helix (wHTH) protein